jgi:hypothetical protein
MTCVSPLCLYVVLIDFSRHVRFAESLLPPKNNKRICRQIRLQQIKALTHLLLGGHSIYCQPYLGVQGHRRRHHETAASPQTKLTEARVEEATTAAPIQVTILGLLQCFDEGKFDFYCSSFCASLFGGKGEGDSLVKNAWETVAFLMLLFFFPLFGVNAVQSTFRVLFYCLVASYLALNR